MPLAVESWKITVGDSLTSTHVVTSKEMSWAEVPSRIITIMLYLAGGRLRQIVGNRDFYWFESDGSLDVHWKSGFAAPADTKIVFKDGFLLDTPTYEKAQDDAMADRVKP